MTYLLVGKGLNTCVYLVGVLRTRSGHFSLESMYIEGIEARGDAVVRVVAARPRIHRGDALASASSHCCCVIAGALSMEANLASVSVGPPLTPLMGGCTPPPMP